MIYTVTFNPAIDYVVQLEHLTQGTVNRTGDEAVYCGGKGINVSTVLTNLGIENVALGFLAGFTGDAVENALQRKGLRTDFIRLQNGMTRINVKIRGACETEINGTEINGKGPDIGPAALALLYKKLDAVTDGDDLVLAGSIPAGMPGDIYEKIMAALQEKKVRVTVDATGDLLLNVLKYRPFLIKPNQHELGELFGRTLKTGDDIRACAAKLQDKGGTSRFSGGRRCDPAGRNGSVPGDRRSAGHGAQCSGCGRFHGGGLFGRLPQAGHLFLRSAHGRGRGQRDGVFR